jgi:hypothetical protein
LVNKIPILGFDSIFKYAKEAGIHPIGGHRLAVFTIGFVCRSNTAGVNINEAGVGVQVPPEAQSELWPMML